VGKTRLALELTARLSRRYEDGAVFVSLAAVVDPALVPSFVAQAMGLREAGSASAAELVCEHLGQRHLLLCLDNLEHLLEAAPFVGEIVQAAPRMAIVATSREALRLVAERECPVRPLPGASAVELFVERARATDPAFQLDEGVADAVDAICARLDGLPLAIELAAARSRILTPAAIRARLDERLSLLTGGARDLPGRQRTLRATLDWSYELLQPEEQRLFRQFAVFAGGARLDAIEEVCGGGLDLVESLVAKSLLVRRDDPDGEPRFEMLETIREYASEQLREAGEAETVAQQHARFYAALAQDEWDAWLGGRARLMRRVAQDQSNVRGAITFALATSDVELLTRLSPGAARFWVDYGLFEEARSYVATMSVLAGDEPEPAWGWFYLNASSTARSQGRLADAEQLAARSVAIFEQAADQRGRGMALRALANVLYGVQGRGGDPVRARELFSESLATLDPLEDDWLKAWAQHDFGYALLAQGEVAEGESLIESAGQIFERYGDVPRMVTVFLNLAEAAVKRGETARARALYRKALSNRWPGWPHYWSAALVGLATLDTRYGKFHRSVRLWGASDAALQSHGAILETSLEEERAQAMASAREALGDEEFERLLAEGRAMSLDEAIAYALEDERGSSR
jgi:predicted ATPase